MAAKHMSDMILNLPNWAAIDQPGWEYISSVLDSSNQLQRWIQLVETECLKSAVIGTYARQYSPLTLQETGKVLQHFWNTKQLTYFTWEAINDKGEVVNPVMQDNFSAAQKVLREHYLSALGKLILITYQYESGWHSLTIDAASAPEEGVTADFTFTAASYLKRNGVNVEKWRDAYNTQRAAAKTVREQQQPSIQKGKEATSPAYSPLNIHQPAELELDYEPDSDQEAVHREEQQMLLDDIKAGKPLHA